MMELYATIPLMDLAERKHDIENFKHDIFPQLSGALEDMGLDGDVSFMATASGPVGYDTVAIRTHDDAKNPAMVTVKFPSTSPRKEYIVKLMSPDEQDVITSVSVREGDLVDMIESFFAEAYGKSSESREGKKSRKKSDDPNVEDAKECKAALDKYVLRMKSMKGLGLETVLTEDASIGAEMPFARVELGVRKDGKLDPYFTFDFSDGMCGINFHLVDEEWDEVLSDYPSVDSMIEDLAPDILEEIESQ